jgi:hypothetical protein
MVAAVARVQERLTVCFITRKQSLDHSGIALVAAIELRESTVSMPKETQHRSHSVMRTAKRP